MGPRKLGVFELWGCELQAEKFASCELQSLQFENCELLLDQSAS